MLHVRVRDGLSQRITGIGDFHSAEDAAEKCRDYLDNANPPAGTEAFVEEDDGTIVYVARISDKGKVTGSWSEKAAARVADELRADDAQE
jgi:hypothetical protein